MLVPNQIITVSWHNVTRKNYEEKGYIFTKYRDYFQVKAEDLSIGCHKKVKVICDYCGKEFDKDYANFLNERKNGKDCCACCQPKKSKEVCLSKYGVDNGAKTEYSKNKQKDTFMKKYGVDNPMKNQDIQQKMQELCLYKYGTAHYIETEEFKEKAKSTFRKNYGVNNPFASAEIQEKIKNTNLIKYGVEHVAASKEIRAKMAKTLSEEGKIPRSKAEKIMCDRLVSIFGSEQCVPCFTEDAVVFDCLVKYKGLLIDFEYDGWYWHKNKQEQDKRRNYFLLKKGYKIVRFIAENEIPSVEQIQEAIDYLVEGNHSLYIKVLDVDINIR